MVRMETVKLEGYAATALRSKTSREEQNDKNTFILLKALEKANK
jgi:hypothetical protein